MITFVYNVLRILIRANLLKLVVRPSDAPIFVILVAIHAQRQLGNVFRIVSTPPLEFVLNAF